MMQTLLWRVLMAPLAFLYGIGVSIRNSLYRAGLLKSLSFSVPVITVGNLSVGGAGKTPHIEYLVRLLNPHIHVATLSRGYGRKTRGVLEVSPRSNAEQVGDEPLQYKRKFGDLAVFVAEERGLAIPQIVGRYPRTQAILLDDAFQHRSVKAGLNILLTEYSRPYSDDYLLPLGRLREWRSAAERADVVIVTKCPEDATGIHPDEWRKRLELEDRQHLFFSYYEYGAPYYLFDSRYRLRLGAGTEVLLISAIANTGYLLQYLEKTLGTGLQQMEFADHHYFAKSDIANLEQYFNRMDKRRRVIITTEKDATRLELHREYLLDKRLPVFVLPTRVAFHHNGSEKFDEIIRQNLLDFKV